MVQQSADDLMKHLREQIEFLVSSSDAYDQGADAEAKRLASVVRVLVHDTPQSHSVLGQLERKEVMSFADTAVPFGFTAAPSDGRLVILNLAADGPRWDARCQHLGTSSPGWVEFADWWGMVVIRDAQGREFTRRDIVLGVANKDGGAHVDPEMPEDYARLSRENSMDAAVHLSPPGSKISWDDIVSDPIGASAEFIQHDASNGPELASVRQIAYEIRVSVEREFTDLWSFEGSTNVAL